MSLLVRRMMTGADFAPGAATGYAAEVLADSPYFYLPLNEPSGATAADSSPNGRDGTYHDVLTYGVADLGGGGTAVELARANTSRVTCPAPPTNLAEMSLELWMKSTDGGSALRHFYSGEAPSGNRNWQLRSNNTDKAVFVKIAGGTVAVTSTNPVSDGDPHHVVVTYDGSDIRLYVDGTLDAAAPATGNITSATSIQPWVSGGNGGSFTGLLGVYQHVALYTTALPASRVAAHFAAA